MNTRTRAGFTLIEIMIVVALIGLLAALAVPNFRKAIRETQQQACALNRKQIDGAKLQWALATHAPEDATPADDDLFGPDRYLEHKPDCPARGAYALNRVAEKCACSLPVHGN